MTEQTTTKPMRSQSQWRFLFGTHKPFARRWAHETPGGPKKRYQRLPVKVTTKAPNYGARAGQVITGRLRRGQSGKFESTGAAPATTTTRRPPSVPRVPEHAKTPEQRAADRAATRQQRQTERAQERAAERAQSRQSVIDAMAQGDVGLQPAAAQALLDFADGKDAHAQTEGLIKAGLMERGRDGSLRLTPAGRSAAAAMDRGDTRDALDAIGRGADRAAAARERAAARQEREQARLAKPAKGGGGGGGSKKPQRRNILRLDRRAPNRSSRAPEKVKPGKAPQAKPTAARSPYADLAQKLSDGQALSTADADTLVRNGLARRSRDGSLSLTASGQRTIRTKAYTPTRTTDDGHTGVMVALYPDQAAAKTLADLEGVTEEADRLHLTLCFLGDSTEQPLATNKEQAIQAVADWAQQHGQPLKGQINGLGRFFHSEEDGTNAVYVAPDVPGLPDLRQSLADWIEKSGFDYSQDHGFTPHITVAYVPKDAPTPPIRVETPVFFDRVTLAWGNELYEFPMGIRTKADSPGDYLVVEDRTKPSTWHLQVKRNGTPDHRLMGSAWAALHSGFRGNTYEGPQKREALAKLKRLYEHEQMPLPTEKAYSGFAVYKDARGQHRWVAYSSNAYRDRDQEIVSTKALADDCARADTDGQYGPLRWWHVGGPTGPGWDLGTCDFNAMHGRVLVESGTFKSAAIGQAVARAAPHLQMSIGFTHGPDQPDGQGVFHHIRRFERSLVPNGRAANPFTRLIVKETRMDKEKEAALKASLGDDVAEQILAGAEATQKDADAQGVAYKADDPWAAVLTALKGAVAAMVAPAAESAPEPVTEKAEPSAEEAKADPMPNDAALVEEEVTLETDPGEMTYDEFIAEIRRVVREELGAELKAQLAPLAGMMDIEKKVSGAVQSLMQPYQAQKDDEVARLKTQLAETQRQIAELQGDVPSAFQAAFGGYRPSQAADTVLKEGDTPPGGAPPPPPPGTPTDADPFADIKQGLFGAALNGRTP